MKKPVQVYRHRNGGVELSLIDQTNGSTNVADLTPKQTDELIAQLTKLRALRAA